MRAEPPLPFFVGRDYLRRLRPENIQARQPAVVQRRRFNSNILLTLIGGLASPSLYDPTRTVADPGGDSRLRHCAGAC
jgi:hypothetical protein